MSIERELRLQLGIDDAENLFKKLRDIALVQQPRVPRVTDAQIDAFLELLQCDPAANRVRTAILPECNARMFVHTMITFAANHAVEGRFIRERRQRARKLIAETYKKINENRRKDLPTSPLFGIIERVKEACSTKRAGLSETYYWAIADGYIHFKTAKRLRPREWEALIRAAFTAAGGSIKVNGDLIEQNVKRFNRRHPGLISGSEAAKIVEGA